MLLKMPKSKLPKLSVPPKNPLVYLLVIIVTLIFGFFSGSYYTNEQQSRQTKTGTVSRIIDGDTIELNTGELVRLNGIACPETGEKFYQEAKDLLTSLALKQTVTLEYQPHYIKDSYSRLLAFVFINGQHLNEQLVRNGWCTAAIYSKRAKLIYQDELVSAQNEAKQEKLGRWVN